VTSSQIGIYVVIALLAVFGCAIAIGGVAYFIIKKKKKD